MSLDSLLDRVVRSFSSKGADSLFIESYKSNLVVCYPYDSITGFCFTECSVLSVIDSVVSCSFPVFYSALDFGVPKFYIKGYLLT